MDDDQKNSTRKGGPKPGGTRSTGGFRKGKAEGGKPFGDGGKKRFAKPGAPAGKPPRPFKRPDGAAGTDPASEKRPYKTGPSRTGGKPFEKRTPREGAERTGATAERREWKPRNEGSGGGDGGREFPRRDGGRSFAPRDGERPERREWKPREEGAGGERKEFVRREGVRSFGSKSHASSNHEGPRRSSGMKSHDEGRKTSFRPRSDAVEEETGERIAKRLARAGIASRRDAEDLIAAGRVTVNGRKLTSPAFNVSVEDKIEVDGTAIPAIERTRLFLFNKPAGVVTTNRDPEGRKTVFDVLPTDLPRLMTVGRLDITTEGLLLLTNDGGLSRVLELPATGWLRRYRARVHGRVDEKALAGLKDGISVDGVFYGSIEASLDREQGTNAWLTIGLREGKNREVKNILGALGLDVTRLIRISYGPFQLGDLPDGHVLEVKGRMLRDQLGERLIEESGANFEADVINPFSNQPVRRAPERRVEEVERPKVMRDGERGRIGEGGLIKKRQRRENTRDEALGKLSTRPDRPKFERGDKPERPKLERGERPDRVAKFGDRPDRFVTFAEKPGSKPVRAAKKPEREQRPIDPPGLRKANVWMAPGARPIGAGRAATEKAEVDAKRSAKKSFGQRGGQPGGKPGFKTRGDRPDGGRPQGDRPGDGKGGPRTPRGRDADRRR